MIAELEWEPSIDPTRIGVAVSDGVVTLTGYLDTFAEKFAVERAVQRGAGVKAIAVEVDVKLDPGHKRSDAEIAAPAESVMKWHSAVPADQIQVLVEKGWVTLKGEVNWTYQRESAEKVIRPLKRVVGVTNAITLKARTKPNGVATRIRDALTRHAEHEAKHIEVIVNGSAVTLRSKVDFSVDKAMTRRAAFSPNMGLGCVAPKAGRQAGVQRHQRCAESAGPDDLRLTELDHWPGHSRER